MYITWKNQWLILNWSLMWLFCLTLWLCLWWPLPTDWLQNQEASGLKQRLIYCALSVMAWLVSYVTTQILICMWMFRIISKTLLPLCIFVSWNPWHLFVEPSLRNTDVYYCATMLNYRANASWLTIFVGRTSRMGDPEKGWGNLLKKT